MAPIADCSYDDNLFHIATYGNHAMHHLLSSPKFSGYNLHTLGHGLCVNFFKSELHKKFINRVILIHMRPLNVILHRVPKIFPTLCFACVCVFCVFVNVPIVKYYYYIMRLP